MKIDNVRIVHIDCPYNAWSEKTGDLFAKMVDLKIKGYRKEYPYGVLPVDTTDFIATHHLVCLETKQGFTPVMGYKTTTLKRSKNFNLPFPGLSLVKSAGAIDHIKSVESIINECEKKDIQLGYTGSWTIDPFIRQDKQLTSDLIGLFTAMYVRYPLDYNIQYILAGGTPRFKTEKLIAKLGHEPLTLGPEVLPPILVAHLHQEQVLVMLLKKFTPEALQIADKWSKYWDQRICIGFDERDKFSALTKSA